MVGKPFFSGVLGPSESLGAVLSAELDSEGICSLELSRVLNRAALGPDDGKTAGQC